MLLNSKNRLFLVFQLSFIFLFITHTLSEGNKTVKLSNFPFPPCIIKKDGIVTSLFPVPQEFSIGMIAGKPDKETLRIAKITGNIFRYEEIPRSKFKAVDETGSFFDNGKRVYLYQHRIVSVVNFKTKKMEIEYLGLGNVIENLILKSWMIDDSKLHVLTVFNPLYDKNAQFINHTYCLTIEDLLNQKRLKSLPINTESGDYKIRSKSEVFSYPDVFKAGNAIIYRESADYKWLAVDLSLNYIEHPLCSLLNDNKSVSPSRNFEMCIDEKAKFAVMASYNGTLKKDCINILNWQKEPHFTPVVYPSGSFAEPNYICFSMSPSGMWIFFTSNRKPHGEDDYLLLIDDKLPGGYFPPLYLGKDIDIRKVSWITNPEGLLIYTGEKFLYWNLDGFEVSEIKSEN